jgi:hypothetical protein
MKDCCKDHKGDLKNKYATFEEAEAVALARRREGGDVRIYECFERDGFHLTSHGYGDGTETEKRNLVRRYSQNRHRNVANKIHQKLDEDTVRELIELRDTLRNDRKPRRR